MSFSQALVKTKENEDSRAKSTPIAMVAPELKQNTDADTEITKTCAVLGCEESKNLTADLFFRFPEDDSLRQIWADLTGRNSWMPTDYSYICVHHFSVDCFECNADDSVVLNNKAVPSLKLPKHVLEVEYIDEETLDNEEDEEEDYEDEDYLMESEEYDEELYNDMQVTNGTIPDKQTPKVCENTEMKEYNEIKESKDYNETKESKEFIQQKEVNVNKKTKGAKERLEKDNVELSKLFTKVQKMQPKSVSTPSVSVPPKKAKASAFLLETENVELLKLFTEVQKMQRQTVSLKEKLKLRMKVYQRQSRFLLRLQEVIEMKRNILSQKRKKKSRILLSLQDKMREDTNGLVLAMPTRHTDDLKNFALSIYNYSPQAYIYTRNTLRTLLPSTDVLDSWVSGGYEPKNVLSNSNMIRVSSELTDTELSCSVSLR